jgi:hypothetical protein
MFYSNLDMNRTVENGLRTKIGPKPLGPPRFPSWHHSTHAIKPSNKPRSHKLVAPFTHSPITEKTISNVKLQ